MSTPQHPVARLLLTALASPDFDRINGNLTESDVADTIKIAIECLEGEQAKELDLAKLRAALVLVQDKGYGQADGTIGLPVYAWETVLKALAS